MLIDTTVVKSINDCLALCQDSDECLWLTHDTSDGICLLFEDCPDMDTSCETCLSSQRQCPEFDGSIPAYTKLLVIGGYNPDLGGDLSSVEVIDLADSSSTCEAIVDYPGASGGLAVGILNDMVKVCGNYRDSNECYDYDPASQTWSNAAGMLQSRYSPRASFMQDIWLVTGDDDPSSSSTSDMSAGLGFVAGPILPHAMRDHCQLTINSTHVFFAGNGYAYLYDFVAFHWTEIPAMSTLRSYPSCGLLNNPDNGLEAVVAEDETSEIFSFSALSWRDGPEAPGFDYASAVQHGDTFVVVGGNHGIPLDTIYQFDNVNYEWILMSQHLDVARDGYPGVVAVPDSYVSCQ